MIYTTCYACLNKINQAEDKHALIIQCSRTRPKFVWGENVINAGKMLGNYCYSIADFEEYFIDALENNTDIIEFCKNLFIAHSNENIDIYLCCYEKDINKCHRKVIKDNLNKKFGKEFNIEITEYELSSERGEI